MLDWPLKMAMPSIKFTKAVPGVRRRVYVLGVTSMVTALGQIIGFLVMLSLVLRPEHQDNQVAWMCVGIAVITSFYLALTGRLLFLFHERRYEETKGPEWMWWFGTLGVVIFNACLVVWFILLPDPIPGSICALAVVLYLLFFKFAKDDVKFLRDDAEKSGNDDEIVPVIRTTSYALASPSAGSPSAT